MVSGRKGHPEWFLDSPLARHRYYTSEGIMMSGCLLANGVITTISFSAD